MMREVFRERLTAFLLPVLALLCVSCGSGGPKLYPVRGKVLYQDKPAEGATVVFHPIASKEPQGVRPSGVVNAEGAFTLHTHPHGDGAPAGDYTVVITWLPENAREQANPKNKLPARYGDVAASSLKATVKDGPTELEPFKLTR